MSNDALDHLALLVEGLESLITTGAFASALDRQPILSGLDGAERALTATEPKHAVLVLRQALEAYPFAYGLLSDGEPTRKLEPPRRPDDPPPRDAPARHKDILNRLIILRQRIKST